MQTGQAPIGEILVSNFENEDPVYGVDVVPFLATRSFPEAKKLWAAQKPVLEKKAAAQGMMSCSRCRGRRRASTPRRK